MHKDDPTNPSATKRYKRRIADGQNDDDGTTQLNMNEPLFYKEEVQFFRETKAGDFETAVKPASERDIVLDLLADLGDVYPMGYPTEQFICKLKNDIIASFIKLKEDRKRAVAEMRRQMFEDGAKMKVERPPEIQRDPGMLEA